jgi:UDP-N-acetylglucosamine--N-acetylmuramyl-(pentapeptide) pyrophosphoryl-undecaprenol N-acetylglucosamine transferase
VAYEESRRHYADRYRGKLVVTGNPVRREILAGDRDEGLRIVGSSGERPLLFVQGGSSGAKQINELLEASLDRLLQRWTIVHQFGRTGRPLSKDPAYFGRGFFSAEYPHLLAAAELVVGRAGAGTIWELSASKTPAVLLPLGSASSRGDQLRNAELFAAAGAAVVLADDEAQPDRLTGVLEELSGNPGMRDRMAEAAGTFGGRHSAAACADLCMELARA